MTRTLLLLLALASLARADYTVVELATTYGFQSSVFNNAGQFAGTRNFGSGNRAFLWSSGGGFQNLGTLGGVGTSSGTAIASNGFVAGNSNGHAFLWQPGVGLTDVGTLGGATSEARGVNSIGAVVGRSPLADGTQRAFLWTSGSGISDLGTLGGNSSQAFAITNGGRVVGSAQDTAGNSRPFLWTTAGGMIDLGTLGGDFGTARAVNDNGQVVGQARRADNTNGAFLYDGSIHDLGGLGGTNAGAFSINAAGQVVGFAEDANGASRAFLWDSVNGLRDLNVLAPGYNFTSGFAINDTGAIVAQAESNDGFTLLLLSPTEVPSPVPAPPAFVLAGIAVTFAAIRRRRHPIV